MKRIFNALRYGDGETRKSIGSVIVFAAVGIGMVIAAVLSGGAVLFVLGLLSGVASLLISQSFELVDDDFVAETDGKGKKETVHALSVKRDGVVFKNSDAFKQMERQGKEEAIREATRVIGEVKREEEEEEERQKKEILKEEKEKKKREEKPAPLGGEEEKDAVLEQYDELALKRVKRKYRVKNDHRPILIDNSRSYHIKECPAFIWRAHKKVYLLLLEKEPRVISISRELIKHVGYVPHVRGNKAEEYRAFEKENLVTSVFREFLPDYFYYRSEKGNYRAKNLYSIYPDIQITNRSIAQVMDLLYLNFMPSDRITRSDQFNGFFKRIYAAHTLFSDKAYSITEYKEVVEQVLGELCYAEMPEREFHITLENLVKGRFISQEYADYYFKMREKVRGMRKQ